MRAARCSGCLDGGAMSAAIGSREELGDTRCCGAKLATKNQATR